VTVRVEKVTRALMHRSLRILDMEYKPSEIAEELGTSKEKILRLISAGAPARKDSKGRYWISGIPFVCWLKDAAPKKNEDKHIFADNECYCVTCRQVVHFTEYRKTHRIAYGNCPKGHKVARFLSLKSKEKVGKNE
jgi:hypothetical protein